MKFDSLDSDFVCTRLHQVPSNRILTKLTLRLHLRSLSVHCEFSRIVCVSLFSYQCSLFTALSSSSSIIPNLFQLVKNFFKKFLSFLRFACRSLKRLCYLITLISLCQQLFFVFSKLFKLLMQKKQFLATAHLE